MSKEIPHNCRFCPEKIYTTNNHFGGDHYAPAFIWHMRQKHPQELARIKLGLADYKDKIHFQEKQQREIKPSWKRFPKIYE